MQTRFWTLPRPNFLLPSERVWPAAITQNSNSSTGNRDCVTVAIYLGMSHHLFILSPSDSPIYALAHQSTKPAPSTSYPLASNLPSWSASAFAGTLSALSGATSPAYAQAGGSGHGSGAQTRGGGQQDRHVIQMIANASLDVVEDVMRRESGMYVLSLLL